MTTLRFSRATFGESHIQLLIKSYSSSLKFRSQCFKIFSVFRRILVSIIRTRQSFNFDNIILQGFIYCKKSETMPEPKFKREKLCHYSKFDQYYRCYITLTMYDFNHTYHTFFNPYFELDFQMDVWKCDFFHYSFEM